MDLVVSGLLSMGSVVYFLKLAKRTPQTSGQKFTFADTVLAVLLLAWFSMVAMAALAASGKPVTVTREMLVFNVVFSLAMVCCVAGFLQFRGISLIETFGLSLGKLKKSLPAAITGFLAALPAVYFVHSLSANFAGTQPQPLLEYLSANPSWDARALLIVTAVLVAPLSEEFFFRGYIYGVFRNHLGRWAALIISVLVFAGIHGHLPAMAGLVVLALALTLIYDQTGSLWAPIIAHALFNSLTIIITISFPSLAP